MTDLLSPLEPPPEDVERPVGTIDGASLEGLGAGLRVWCGPAIGWRPLGDVSGVAGTVVRMRGRLLVGLAFDLGEAPPMRRHADDDEDAHP